MANTKGFTREQMDDFAISSLKKAQTAITEGYFKEEIVPVEVKTRKGVEVVDQDEQPLKANLEKSQLYALLLARTVQLQLLTQARFLMVLLH
jgi:acetyl-CoA acetyltransferase